MSSTRPSPRNNLAKENNNNIQPEANVSWRNIATTLVDRIVSVIAYLQQFRNFCSLLLLFAVASRFSDMVIRRGRPSILDRPIGSACAVLFEIDIDRILFAAALDQPLLLPLSGAGRT
jgi:hypothetical protein